MKTNNESAKKKTKKSIIADEQPRLLETKEKRTRGENQKDNNSALDESSLSLSSLSSSSSSQEALIPLGKDEETYHVYSAVFIKLFSSSYSSSSKTTKTTRRRGGESFEKSFNKECFLSLAFYGDDEDKDEDENEFGGRRSSTSSTLFSVSLERVSLSGRSDKGGKGGVSVVPCVAAFAAMDEIRFSSLSSSLRFVLTNAENKRVCEGRLNTAGEAAAASIWSRVESEEDEREEEKKEEEKGKKVLSPTEKKAITETEAATRGKRRGESDEETCRLEMSFVGENATVKASCEVPAEKFFAIPSSNERRISSSSWEHSPTPSSERGGGAGSEKSVSWHEFNVDRRDDFSNSSGDDDVDDDEIDDDDEKNDLKTLLVRGNTTTNSSESSSRINGKEEKIMKPAMMRNKKNSKLVSCLRELIPLEIPSAVASSGNMILRKIDDSKAYAQDTTALIRAQYAELTKEWNHTKAKLNSSGDIISEEEEEEDSIRGTNRALVEMQQMTIVDDGMKSVVSGRAGANASTETRANELSWFSAGVRIGVGVGLGTCLGVGIGVGILVNGMVAGKDKIARIRTVVKSRITGS